MTHLAISFDAGVPNTFFSKQLHYSDFEVLNFSRHPTRFHGVKNGGSLAEYPCSTSPCQQSRWVSVLLLRRPRGLPRPDALDTAQYGDQLVCKMQSYCAAISTLIRVGYLAMGCLITEFERWTGMFLSEDRISGATEHSDSSEAQQSIMGTDSCSLVGSSS